MAHPIVDSSGRTCTCQQALARELECGDCLFTPDGRKLAEELVERVAALR